MLFRARTDVAMDAVFGEKPDLHHRPAQPIARQPDPITLELEQTRAELQALRRDMENLQEQWDAALAKARYAAKSEAAEQHKNDDERAYRALRETLDQAQSSFELTLGRELEQAAETLAASAFSRLVGLRQTERDWLNRVIKQRLTRLKEDSVAMLHVSPDIARQLASADDLPCEVITDAALPNGKAVIRLELGQIEIDPNSGVSRLLQALGRPIDG